MSPVGLSRAPSARLDQQHQCKQAEDLRFPGHQVAEEPPKPDRLRAEILADQPVPRARGVSLVED